MFAFLRPTPNPAPFASPAPSSFPHSHGSLSSLSPPASSTSPGSQFVDEYMHPMHASSSSATSSSSSAFAPRFSVLHRRSRAEAEQSSDDESGDSDGVDSRLRDDDSDDDSLPPSHAAFHHHLHSKRVKLNTLLPLSFDSSPVSPTLGTIPPSSRATVTSPSSSSWAPNKPTRSRSLGDTPHCPPSSSSDSPPLLSLPVPSLCSPSKRSSPVIVPPAPGPRSILPFSPRSHAQFLVPPTVNHSPRAALPLNLDGASSPLETLFTRLTMHDDRAAAVAAFDRPGKGSRGYTSRSSKKPEHRRSLSISISPATSARSSGDSSPARPTNDADAESKSPQPAASSWLVRVDSVGDMNDGTGGGGAAASSVPSVLTGSPMLHFFEALQMDSNDWCTLALAWKWNCSTGGIIYRHEFIAGMRSMGCTTIEQLQEKVRELRAQLEREPALFKAFFSFVFSFVRNTQESNRKTIGLDTARRLLQSLLAPRYPQHIEPFARYLEGMSDGRRMTYDQWMSVLDWCESMDDGFTRYEEEGSWPVLIDEFVDWMRAHEPQRMRHYEHRLRARGNNVRPMVDRLTRMEVKDSSEEQPSSPPLSTHRSSLSVRVPRPSSIDALSLDSDDHRTSWSRGSDGLSRSLPSLPSLEVRLMSSPGPERRVAAMEQKAAANGPLTVPFGGVGIRETSQQSGVGGPVFSSTSWARDGHADDMMD